MNIVILAAGQGRRMQSERPKVLHLLAGQSLLAHVISLARNLDPKRIIIVVGQEQARIQQQLTQEGVALEGIDFVRQHEALGTGHAVLQALPYLIQTLTLVLYADVPLLQKASVQDLLHRVQKEETQKIAVGVLTGTLDCADGYGRIIRKDEDVVAIREERDATPAERAIREVSSGILLCTTSFLKQYLPVLSNHNAQGEYYLSDIVAMAKTAGFAVISSSLRNPWEMIGINNHEQLALAEQKWRALMAAKLLQQGVRLADPTRLDVRGTLHCGRDVSIDVGCIFEGVVHLGDACTIGPYSMIRDSYLAAKVQVHAYSHIDSAEIAQNAKIGPYARIRPGSVLAENTKIGNFVEIKNSALGKNSQASHLSYLGDAQIGADVNIGAGTITCNYDGQNKHQTVIEDGAFIGSGSQLIAPITVGAHALIGAGTTLTKPAPAGQLTLTRAKQVAKPRFIRKKPPSST